MSNICLRFLATLFLTAIAGTLAWCLLAFVHFDLNIGSGGWAAWRSIVAVAFALLVYDDFKALRRP